MADPAPEVHKCWHGVLTHCSEPSRTFSGNGFGLAMEMIGVCDSDFPAFLPDARPSEPRREGAVSQPRSLKGAALISHHWGMCMA